MKNIITILLLLVMLTQSFSKVFILLDYQANKNYIAQFLCINKEKPQLQCQGHCYLQRELKKASQSENQTTNQKQKPVVEIMLFCQALFTYPLLLSERAVAYSSFYQPVGIPTFLAAIFHPPRFLV